MVIKYFLEAFPKETEYIDIINSYSYRLKNFFDTYIPKLKQCEKTCRSCARFCALRLNHKNNCNCETSHVCMAVCNKSEECESNGFICVEVYGHLGDHRCNEGNHKCSNKCEIENCMYLCSGEAGHPPEVAHNCGNKHPCSHRCEDSYCTRTCQFDLTFEHTQHICGETKCIHKCNFCDLPCIF